MKKKDQDQNILENNILFPNTVFVSVVLLWLIIGFQLIEGGLVAYYNNSSAFTTAEMSW